MSQVKMLTNPNVVKVIQDKFPGRRIAFVPVRYQDEKFFGLGVVVESESGYAPLPWQLAYAPTMQDMRDNAKHLNETVLRLSEDEVDQLMATSMRSDHRWHS